MRRRTIRTDRARETFLAALAKSGNVTAAAKAATIGRRSAHEWRTADPAFAAAWDEALETATDALEAEARRRGHLGWLEPVYQGGKKVGEVRRYSDRMLELLLKGHRPQFRDREITLKGPGGGPIPVQASLDLSALSSEDLRALAAMAKRVRGVSAAA